MLVDESDYYKKVWEAEVKQKNMGIIIFLGLLGIGFIIGIGLGIYLFF